MNAHDIEIFTKRLFLHRQVVMDLVRGFVPALVRNIKPQSLILQPELTEDERFQQRQSEVAWMYELESGHKIALFIAVRSTVDESTVNRMLDWAAAYLDAVTRSNPDEASPILVPVVFYMGREPWSAERSMILPSDDRSSGAQPCAPMEIYFLIDVRRLPMESLPERNHVSLMIKMLVAKGPDDLIEVLGSAAARLDKADVGMGKGFTP